MGLRRNLWAAGQNLQGVAEGDDERDVALLEAAEALQAAFPELGEYFETGSIENVCRRDLRAGR